MQTFASVMENEIMPISQIQDELLENTVSKNVLLKPSCYVEGITYH